MRRYFCSSLAVLAALLSCCSGAATAQQSPNANAVYGQLRALSPSGEAIAVSNLVLQRGGAILTLRTGTIAFYPPVNGKVTGAVFMGQGNIHLLPPSVEERHNLATLTHSDVFDQDFEQMVMRFTDDTAQQLRKASTGSATFTSADERAAQELWSFQRGKLDANIDLRLLEDVLSPAPGGYFLAAIRGNKDHHLFLTVDPHGAPHVDPEQVSLVTWNGSGPTFLTAFNPPAATAPDAPGTQTFRVDHEDIDTAIDRNGFLTGVATLHLVAQQDGLAVAALQLYPTLRVSRVASGTGQPLDFVQASQDQDADLGVVLARPLAKGEAATVRVEYAGKDVVMDEGGANYYPVARQSWYPNASTAFGDFTTYRMTFHVPKGLDLVATGTKVSEKTEGKITTTEWKTDVPLAVVGFNLGKFEEKQDQLRWQSGGSLSIEAFANSTEPDVMQFLSRDGFGSLNASRTLPIELGQADVAAQLYTQYYGPIPFRRIALTQQFACNYGQSWPMLIYLPFCGFLDSTQQRLLHLNPQFMYWRAVTPHEVAHQWWGQTVGFRSYRDQWMSEGFAGASAALFLQTTRSGHDDYLQFWKLQQQILTRKNEMGFRPIDVGPVTMGFRLNSPQTGWDVYQNLVYPKGAFILHMIRMMMWSPQQGDKPYIAMMHDFLRTYSLNVATTEDFKAMVEKHMTPQMDLEGNHRMDWFFREYVYGTDLPVYHFEGSATPNGIGWKIHVLLRQSGVESDFVNSVPLYLRLANGEDVRLGSVRIAGSTTVDQTLELPKMPSDIQQVLINYNYDVLCAYD